MNRNKTNKKTKIIINFQVHYKILTNMLRIYGTITKFQQPEKYLMNLIRFWRVNSFTDF